MGHKHRSRYKHQKSRQNEAGPPTIPDETESDKQDPDQICKCCEKKENPTKTWRSPEVWTAIGTLLLAGFSIPSFIFLYKQLEESHKALVVDQRAWIHIEVQGFRTVENKPIVVDTKVTNTGKTPAKHVSGRVIVEKISKYDTPSFIYEGHPRALPSTGIMFPNSPVEISFQTARFKAGNQDIESNTEPLPISSKDIKELADGDAYTIIHGIFTYEDAFQVPHWVKFCTYNTLNIEVVKWFVKSCSDYNDADSN